jgi:hypothetical protein
VQSHSTEVVRKPRQTNKFSLFRFVAPNLDRTKHFECAAQRPKQEQLADRHQGSERNQRHASDLGWNPMR